MEWFDNTEEREDAAKQVNSDLSKDYRHLLIDGLCRLFFILVCVFN
jgi:hypothetical protein